MDHKFQETENRASEDVSSNGEEKESILGVEFIPFVICRLFLGELTLEYKTNKSKSKQLSLHKVTLVSSEVV